MVRVYNSTRMKRTQSPKDVQQWTLRELTQLWPAALGSLSLRKSPCIRTNCAACRSGKGHPSYVLYGRKGGRRFSLYVPEELVGEVNEALANGRKVQELLNEAGWRYTQALKEERRKG